MKSDSLGIQLYSMSFVPTVHQGNQPHLASWLNYNTDRESGKGDRSPMHTAEIQTTSMQKRLLKSTNSRYVRYRKGRIDYRATDKT